LAQLKSDPLDQQVLLDLAVGEAVSKVSDDAKRKFDSSFCPLAVGQGLLYKLENSWNVCQEQAHLLSVLEADDNTAVCFQNTFAELLDIFDKLNIQLNKTLGGYIRRDIDKTYWDRRDGAGLVQHANGRGKVRLKCGTNGQCDIAEARQNGDLDVAVENVTLQVLEQHTHECGRVLHGLFAEGTR
jgi:hypothetical protein